MIEWIDETEERLGTEANRKNFMAMQGFIDNEIEFDEETNTITETNSDGQTKTTTFNEDGSITETFVGEKTIVKTTIFNEDGSITEVIS